MDKTPRARTGGGLTLTQNNTTMTQQPILRAVVYDCGTNNDGDMYRISITNEPHLRSITAFVLDKDGVTKERLSLLLNESVMRTILEVLTKQATS